MEIKDAVLKTLPCNQGDFGLKMLCGLHKPKNEVISTINCT